MNKSSSPMYLESGNECEVFEKCFREQIPVLIKGPTGCGKSQFVDFMAHKLDRPVVKVACNEDTSSADLLGRFLLKGGDTIWQDGPVVRAIKTESILYLDEIAEAREDVIVALHPLTDHRREIYLDKTNEKITASKRFMVVASYNPSYQKSARSLKPSTRQRFVSIPFHFLTLEKEMEVLIQQAEIDKDTAKKLAKMAHFLREKSDLQLEETVSTRLLIHAAKLIKMGTSARQACYVAVAEALSDDVPTVKALRDFIDLSL